MNIFGSGLVALGLLAATQAFGQSVMPPPAIAAPTYVSVVQEMAVARPAAEVWARIGRYCDIREYLGRDCVITSGHDGELGAVRALTVPGGPIIEMLVAKTPLSYTYSQPVRVGEPFNVYHGTIEVRPMTAKTSKLIYSIFWDNSMLPDDAARAQDRAVRTARFKGALEKMKALVENNTPRP